MSKRTKILLLLAALASIPFGIQLWRNTLGCMMVGDDGGGYRVDLVRDPSGRGQLPCPVESASQLSSSFIVLSWITFGCASVLSGTRDATDALLASRRSGPGEAWIES